MSIASVRITLLTEDTTFSVTFVEVGAKPQLGRRGGCLVPFSGSSPSTKLAGVAFDASRLGLISLHDSLIGLEVPFSNRRCRSGLWQ